METGRILQGTLHIDGAGGCDGYTVKLWIHEIKLGPEDVTDTPNKG
jgi:hypothetical protein